MSGVTIFANGECPHPQLVKALIPAENILIAADGGYHLAVSLGYTPDHVVGDMDSIAPNESTSYPDSITFHRFPPEKDQTDLELCLDLALSLRAADVTIVGGLGGRADHYLANITLIFAPKFSQLDIKFIDGLTTIGKILGERSVQGSLGDTFSLLPWGMDVTGITTKGLSYPLRGETLFAGSPRGVSNQMDNELATIRADKGNLLFIHIKNGEKPDEN